MTALLSIKEIIEFVLKQWRIFLGLAVVAGIFMSGYHYRDTEMSGEYAKKMAAYEAKILTLDRDLAQAKADGALAVANKEHEMAKRIADIDKQHQQEITDAKTTLGKTIDDLRAGNRRLRDRFNACSTRSDLGAHGAGYLATGSGIGNAGTQGGLSEQDAEFLVRFAGEADDVVRQLRACQAVIISDRQG